MADAHVDTVLGLLRVAAAGRAGVFDAVVAQGATAPYVVLHAGLGDPERTRLAGPSDRIDFPWQITAVGSTPEQARWSAGIARGALVDKRVTVPGRQPARIGHTGSQPVTRDDDVDPPVFYAVDLFNLTTYPARGE